MSVSHRASAGILAGLLMIALSVTAHAVMSKEIVVTGANGSPVPKTEVTILDNNGKEVGKGMTGDNGVLVFPFPDGAGTYTAQWASGSMSVNIPAGEAASKTAEKDTFAAPKRELPRFSAAGGPFFALLNGDHIDGGFGVGATVTGFIPGIPGISKLGRMNWYGAFDYGDYSATDGYSIGGGLGISTRYDNEEFWSNILNTKWDLIFNCGLGLAYRHFNSYEYDVTYDDGDYGEDEDNDGRRKSAGYPPGYSSHRYSHEVKGEGTLGLNLFCNPLFYHANSRFFWGPLFWVGFYPDSFYDDTSVEARFGATAGVGW